MGQLNEPLNTFWQFFFRPASSPDWSNDVEATAVATNGGLVLASEGNEVLVGIRPSNKLTFSPVIASADGGSSWSNGLLTSGLASRPDALALGPTGGALALVSGANGDQVLSSDDNPSSWRTLTTSTALASASARDCGLTGLSAVGYAGSSPVIGGSCARPGVVGVFFQGTGGFDLDGPSLPESLARARAQVLSLQSTAAGISALVGVTDRSGTALVAAWAGSRATWTVSAPLALSPSERIASFGPETSAGTFVLLRRPSGTMRAVVDTPGTAWSDLPDPPPNTETLAFGQGTAPQALAVNNTVLNVWTLAPGSGNWAQTQKINVPIQFGSSN